jgi:hypothetical protein
MGARARMREKVVGKIIVGEGGVVGRLVGEMEMLCDDGSDDRSILYPKIPVQQIALS